jgi:chaperonin GroES
LDDKQKIAPTLKIRILYVPKGAFSLRKKILTAHSKIKFGGKTMKIIPLMDRILLRSVPEEVTAGGIFVPSASAERSQIMDVVAVGSDVGNKLAIGMRVLVSRYAGSEVNTCGEKFIVARFADVLAVIEKE